MQEAGDFMPDAFYNKTVTIWNKGAAKKGDLWGRETWYPTIIKNVRLLVSRGTNIQQSGNSSADSCRLHIMDRVSKPDKKYLPPAEWHASEEQENYYTLESEKDSFFTEGDSSGAETAVDNFFETMKDQYNNCFRISSVDRFDIIPHWEVWGK